MNYIFLYTNHIPRIYLLIDRLIYCNGELESAIDIARMKKIFGAIRNFHLKAKNNIQSVVSLPVKQTGFPHASDRFVEAQPGEKKETPVETLKISCFRTELELIDLLVNLQTQLPETHPISGVFEEYELAIRGYMKKMYQLEPA